MGYEYEKERPRIFTEDGQVMFLDIRDNAKRLMEQSGAATAAAIMHGVTGDTWKMLACFDRLVELGEIRRIDQPDHVAGQDWIFVPCNRKN